MSDRLNANIDYINRILQLTTDQQIELMKRAGFSMTDAKNLLGQGLANEKLKALEVEKTAAFVRLSEELEKMLKNESLVNNASVITNSLFSNQGNIYGQNEQKLKSINNDIATLRRQIMIGENQYKNYSNMIFYLKTILVAFILLIIVFVLGRNGILDGAFKNKIAVVIIIGCMAVIFYQFWSNIGRDRVFFDIRNWRE